MVHGGPGDPCAASRSLWAPDRCDCVNTTPSGVPARQPLDVLNYNTVIHNPMLTGCGRMGAEGDEAVPPRVKAEDACTQECG
ncbi:hypothetical protein FM106_01295 [Brachybacterium faecium]|nr:hypothetical protein FM106_01295 [Brachybacterium faecium]